MYTNIEQAPRLKCYVKQQDVHRVHSMLCFFLKKKTYTYFTLNQTKPLILTYKNGNFIGFNLISACMGIKYDRNTQGSDQGKGLSWAKVFSLFFCILNFSQPASVTAFYKWMHSKEDWENNYFLQKQIQQLLSENKDTTQVREVSRQTTTHTELLPHTRIFKNLTRCSPSPPPPQALNH